MDKSKMKIWRNIAVTAFIAAIVILSSCEKYVWEPEIYVPPDTTGGFDTIYYSAEIAPLFPAYGCTGCHPAIKDPDLSVDNSYESLTTGGYIDLVEPTESIIVVKIDEPHMGGMSNDDLTLIIDWIYQGAENY